MKPILIELPAGAEAPAAPEAPAAAEAAGLVETAAAAPLAAAGLALTATEATGALLACEGEAGATPPPQDASNTAIEKPTRGAVFFMAHIVPAIAGGTSYNAWEVNPELRAAITARLGRARELLRERGWYALWLGQSTNLRYLSGVVEKPSERLFGAFVPADAEPAMVVPRMYHDEMGELAAISTVRSWTDEDGMASAVDRYLEVPPGATVAVDPLLHASFLFLLQEQLRNVTFVSAGGLLSEMRLYKDHYEKACLRRAAQIADAVMVEVTGRSPVGRKERDIATEIERLFYEGGSEGVSFSPIASAGPNAAFPHHWPDDTTIEPGQCLVLDFGGVHQGYASDMTRTIFAGEPPAEMRRIYEVVRAAQQHAVAHLRPGMAAQAADALAREYVSGAGYGSAFIHRLGHGIGLDVHEAPYLVAGNTAALRPGVAFSVEPGVYVTGLGGVRIEDIVVMNDQGPERLNHVPREFLAF
jgi:Xaa-Pro aminopeptidase